MTTKAKTASTSRAHQKALLKLSPFELKDELIKLARVAERDDVAQFLDAGRGNPNWICTTPRDAYGTLLRFGLEESRRGLTIPDAGRQIARSPGLGERFETFLKDNPKAPGIKLLRDTWEYGTGKLKFDPDTFAYELAEGIIGDLYPVPDRMLRCCERIVHEFLAKEMCDNRPPKGKFDIFAVEGGTAAMCYIFDTLMQNELLHRGDTIALAVPIFTPYIEMAHMDRFAFKVVHIDAAAEYRKDGSHTWQYSDAEIEKLADPKVKAFFLVNPSNPPSVAMSGKAMKRLVKLVKTKRPDLIVITDDVYGTFVPGFRSAMAELPQNTIFVYSYSKYFGCTGWRLGVVALHENNIFDKMIAKLPAQDSRQAGPPLQSDHAGAREGEVHRPHGGGQPDGRAEPHGRPVAPVTGPDDAVLSLHVARQVGQLQKPLPTHLSPPVACAVRRARPDAARRQRPGLLLRRTRSDGVGREEIRPGFRPVPPEELRVH